MLHQNNIITRPGAGASPTTSAYADALAHLEDLRAAQARAARREVALDAADKPVEDRP